MEVAYEELTWASLRPAMMALNPELGAIFDALSPTDQYTFFKFKYQYGDQLLRQTELYLPTTSGGLISMSRPSVSRRLKESLSYNFGSNPVGMLLKNSMELFIPLRDRVVPFAMIKPGRVFGAWKILDENISYHPTGFPWGMAAGARSIFMLPKISETIAHGRLSKKYQLRAEKPHSFMDHWAVFREIANHDNPQPAWEMEVVFFSSEWFKKLNDPAWSQFKLYLLNAAWQSSGFWRNQFIWRFLFSLTQQNRNIRAPAYIFDTVRHLIALSIGALPGFRPAIDDSLAPISRLQAAYTDARGYALKKYAPIIMEPSYFSAKKGSPIYYSLQYPTTTEFSLKSSERVSTITETHLVHSLMKKFLLEIRENKLKMSETPLEFLSEGVCFDYFHNDVSEYRDLRDGCQIPHEDDNFSKAAALYSDLPFPKNSSFFNGCVRITKK